MLLTVKHNPHLRLEITVSELPESKGLLRCALQQSEAYADCVLSWEAYRVDVSAERRGIWFQMKMNCSMRKCIILLKTKNSTVNKSVDIMSFLD